MKKPAKVLRNPYSAPVWKATNRHPNINVLFPHFLETEKMPVCALTFRLPKKYSMKIGGIFVLSGS
jgi:hypothetical protein